MKYSILLIFILLSSIKVEAQEKNFNPYNEALTQFIHTYLDENEGFDKIYILENGITNSLLQSINYKNKTVLLLVVNNKQLLKGNIKSVLEIQPINVTNKDLTIDVIHFGVEIKKKKINLINSMSGVSYRLVYNCSAGNYSIQEK